MSYTNQSVGTTATRKRKDRDIHQHPQQHQNSSFYSPKGIFGSKPQFQHPRAPNNKPAITPSFNNTTSSEPGSGSANRLLAGYMAHEFLTKGTLFGQKFDPARAEAVPVSAAEPKRKSVAVEPVVVKPSRSYAEVAQLLMGSEAGGSYIPGIVNPAQLGRWIRM